MLRTTIKNKTINILEDGGYVTSEYKGCFDVAARKGNFLLLKILQNVDAFQFEQAKNLKIISNNLDARPLVIGKQTRREKLRKGFVYERFELPTLSLETFRNLISHNIFPNIYRDRGGLYVSIDSELLKRLREEKGFTQKKLAEKIGVNKKMIYEHEKKELRMLLTFAKRIENVLGEKLIRAANPFRKFVEHGKPQDNLERRVGRDLRKLGFGIDFVKQAPFDVFAREKVLLISDIEDKKRRIFKRANELKNFVKVSRNPAIIITERFKEDLGIPVLRRKDLKEFENSKELIKEIKW